MSAIEQMNIETNDVTNATGPIASQSMGEILIQTGKLKLHDAERVIQYQRKNRVRFGEAAIKLKLITRDDLEQALACQFSYPFLRKGEGNLSSELVAAYKPFSKQVEGLRAVRSHLMLRWFSNDHKTLAIVGAGIGEGRSYTVANLGVVFSQLGERTLLIDADLRSPRLHGIFNVPNDTGLSSLLSGRTSENVIKRVDALANLAILPAGPIPPNPQELLSHDKFANLLAGAENHFDVILIDTPASSLYSDAEIITSRVGGAIMLARKGKSRLADTKRLVEKFNSAGVQIVGSVLNEG